MVDSKFLTNATTDETLSRDMQLDNMLYTEMKSLQTVICGALLWPSSVVTDSMLVGQFHCLC